MIARTPIPEQAASARVLVLGADRPQRAHAGFGTPGPGDGRILAVPALDAVPADCDPEVLLVAPQLPEPRRLAAAFRRDHPATRILFAIPPEQTERFEATLPFTPDLAGSAVIATTASAEELQAALNQLAAAARQERGVRALYGRLNAMLAAGGAPAERKEADAERQRQLVLAERYLGTILAQSPQALFATDRTGNFLQRNAAAQRLFGRSRSSLLEHFPADARRDLERVLHLAGQGSHPDMIELALPEEGGSEKWIQLKAAPIVGADGAVEALSFSAQDVTERRRAERALEESARRLSTMANAIPQLAWTANSHGEAEWYNDRWYEYTGLSPEQSLGRGWVAVLHPDHAERVIAGLQEHLVTGEPWEDRFPLRAADGNYRWFLTRAIPMRDADGRLMRWFGTNTDVTEQLEAEQALRELTENLEQRVAERTRELKAANEALVEAMQKREAVEERVRQMQKLEAVGQLTGGIAHDFNNMLAVIINSLEVIKLYHERGRTDVGQFIESARKAGMRAATLTRSLLAFARRQPLSPQSADANELIGNMAALLNSTLRENIAVQYVYAPGLWLTHVDLSQLENAILNLAVNARDAMPEGGRVIIETANVEIGPGAATPEGKPGAYVRISVTDTGHGMTPEVAKRAFDPFYTTKEVGQGTGLGLSQVLGFVQQSGGYVSIESAPGRGTSVRLHLPRFEGDSEAGAPPQAETPVSAATHGERILLVEDDDGVRELMTQVLADLGYKVIAAAGPLAALRLLDQHPDLDLLLTDVVMPEMNGRKLADEAVRRRPQLKVLFTSGYPRDAVVHNGVIDPGVQFLPKPATSEQIAQKVRAVLSA